MDTLFDLRQRLDEAVRHNNEFAVQNAKASAEIT